VTTVTIPDIRAAGYCWAGIRLFAKRNGIDWGILCKQGIPADSLPPDAMCAIVIQNAISREKADGQ